MDIDVQRSAGENVEGAGAVVTEDIPDNVTIVRVPAKVIKLRA